MNTSEEAIRRFAGETGERMESTSKVAAEKQEIISPFTQLYQLHLDVESLAHELRERRKRGWAPLRDHVEALYELSIRLKVLDKARMTKFPDLRFTRTKFY